MSSTTTQCADSQNLLSSITRATQAARETHQSKRARESVVYVLNSPAKRVQPTIGSSSNQQHVQHDNTRLNEAATDVVTVALPEIADLVSETLFNKPSNLSFSFPTPPALPSDIHSLVSSLCNPLKGLITQESQLRDTCISLRESLVHGRVPKSLSVSNRLELPSSTLQHWLPAFLDLKKRFEQDSLYILLLAKQEEFAQLQSTICNFITTVNTAVAISFKISPTAALLTSSIHNLIMYNTYMSWISFCSSCNKRQAEKKKLAPPSVTNNSNTEATVGKIVKAALHKELALLKLSSKPQKTSAANTTITASKNTRPPLSKPGKKDAVSKPVAAKARPPTSANPREKQPPKKKR